jgi:hypothetical protein
MEQNGGSKKGRKSDSRNHDPFDKLFGDKKNLTTDNIKTSDREARRL